MYYKSNAAKLIMFSMVCIQINIFKERRGLLYTKEGRIRSFWQKIVILDFCLVAWNAIKMRFKNTVFYVYIRKLSQNWGKLSGTLLILSNSWHIKCPLIAQYFFGTIFLSKHNLMNCITSHHFYAIISCESRISNPSI